MQKILGKIALETEENQFHFKICVMYLSLKFWTTVIKWKTIVKQ